MINRILKESAMIVASCLLAAGIAYWMGSGSQSEVSSLEEIDSTPNAKSSSSPTSGIRSVANRTLSSVPSVQPNPIETLGKQVEKGEGLDTSFPALLSKQGLQEKHAQMEKVFSRTLVGSTVARFATVFFLSSNTHSPASSLAVKDLDTLEEHPYETLEELQRNLGKLNSEFIVERQLLTQIATRLNVDQKAKEMFLSDQLKGLSSNSNSDPFLPILSGSIFREYMNVVQNSGQIEKTLKEVLNSKVATSVKEGIAAEFLAQYPTKKDLVHF